MQSNKNFMLYGLGSVAFGIKNNAFGWFLLFYYNIVLGLPGWMASLAIAIALIIDAVSDLLIGYASDHTRSKFGRRHPYMYAALLPVPSRVFCGDGVGGALARAHRRVHRDDGPGEWQGHCR